MKSFLFNLKLKKRVKEYVLVSIIMILTLIVFDLVCIKFNLFPPHYNVGEPELGWAPPMSGKIFYDTCIDNPTGQTIRYVRNELGIRTDISVEDIMSDDDSFKVAVLGDSHTDLCAPNLMTHPGVFETVMNNEGIKTLVLPYGQGAYSPLQSYLLFKKRLKRLKPDALMMNFYTGNDFFDMLRIDDRPYFEKTNSAYRIHDPIWYFSQDPLNSNWRKKSRIIFIFHTLATKVGIRKLSIRIRHLAGMATKQEQGKIRGLRKTFSYLRDIHTSMEPTIGYKAAFSAQILNQQLLFYHFPLSRDESFRRVRYLMKMIRDENPNILLIMSPLPSYQLVCKNSLDDSFMRVIKRMPFTYEDSAKKGEDLYYILKDASEDLGWVFIDNLIALRAYNGSKRLYNDFDYHLTIEASKIIGSNEAKVVLRCLR